MGTNRTLYQEDPRQLLDRPLDKRIVALLSGIERSPALYIGKEINIRCLFHFLNGWQMAISQNQDRMDAGLNEKMNAFLALQYDDYDSLNWEQLLIRHEGEDAAYEKFFVYYHMMENQ